MVRNIVFWTTSIVLSPVILFWVLALTSRAIAQLFFDEIDRRWLP